MSGLTVEELVLLADTALGLTTHLVAAVSTHPDATAELTSTLAPRLTALAELGAAVAQYTPLPPEARGDG